MRKPNWRVVMTGLLLIVMAVGFFLFGLDFLAQKSNDPAALMQTVGTVSGVAGGLGVVMAAIGLIGRRK